LVQNNRRVQIGRPVVHLDLYHLAAALRLQRQPHVSLDHMQKVEYFFPGVQKGEKLANFD
jgi:hypothetical protein